MNKHKRLSGGLPWFPPVSFLLGCEGGTLSKTVKMCSDSENKTQTDGDMLNENQTKQKEICTDNNLLWGGKAYSFGDFVCYLGWDASHVENTGCSFTEDGFAAFATRDVNFHNCLIIWKE